MQRNVREMLTKALYNDNAFTVLDWRGTTFVHQSSALIPLGATKVSTT